MPPTSSRTALKRLAAGWASVSSDTHRTRNEDAFLVIPERGFFGVFDGMGGHAHADLAARLAAEEVQETLLPLSPDASDEAVADTLRDAFFAADDMLRVEAPTRHVPEGLGTTGLVVVLRPRGATKWSAMIAWVGDSRVYLLAHGSRALNPLTLDDGVVRLHAASVSQARRYQGALGQVTDARHLSLRERDFFLERHVLLQAVGTSLRHVHIIEHTIHDGDRILLVTDGVHDNLTDREMLSILRRMSSSGASAQRLVRAAQHRSRQRDHLRAKPDDMTAIVVRLGVSTNS